jgi:hypothetical protein
VPSPKAIALRIVIKGEVKTSKGVQSILNKTIWETFSQKFSKKTGETEYLLRAK